MRELQPAEYRIWINMNGRCTNPNLAQYPNYGRKGIRVCPEWKDSFETFYKDMGARPTPLHILQRKDVTKNFSPDNCFWEKSKVNLIRPLEVDCLFELVNKPPKPICFIDYEGQNRTITEWAAITGIPYSVLVDRVHGKRLSLAKALETPYLPNVL